MTLIHSRWRTGWAGSGANSAQVRTHGEVLNFLRGEVEGEKQDACQLVDWRFFKVALAVLQLKEQSVALKAAKSSTYISHIK